MEILGNHLLLDLWGMAEGPLNDVDALQDSFVGSAKRGGAHVVDARFCRFAPHGISGVVILAESHLTVHTWPELGYAAVDVFTCGAREVAERIAQEVVESLGPLKHRIRRLRRGFPEERPVAPRAQISARGPSASDARG